ncbi:hypothetical protein PAXRUDRAFT_726338 [Paxillus rubicundulus Ve08.2h10]|uniref:Unplaced genomic scaffold scaffold_847, whole genome shotgun sequence n=1 Tax=Paxillus rubicundulus Ve08.2h10 TaxID=930991 RepID=A0A0D0DKD2_9AGAM|nr:hypothetical protein PAXRUDRAFT_726338 [Paxillus rubicundulus Ve08.2h10]
MQALTDADLREGQLMPESEVTSWCQVFIQSFFTWIDLPRCHRFKARIQQYLENAIFSHRWRGRDPGFYQMLNQSHGMNTPPTGQGYEKLLRSCEKAMSDYGCRYVWSDTCCINKYSNAELEGRIRVMYQWYKYVSVSIVHLARSSSVKDFPNVSWFTRGWTSQELPAPRKMRFYGRDWTPICRESCQR